MVEICVTRIIIVIREIESIERYVKVLVGFWDFCLEYNLRFFGKDEDIFYVKIVFDIMSCIL